MNKEIEEKIWDYADGMLPESERDKIEKILDENEECKLLLTEILKIRKVISGLNPPHPSEKTFEKIMMTYKSHCYTSVKSYRPELNKTLILIIGSILIGTPVLVLITMILKFSIHMSSILNAIQGNRLVALLVLLNVIFAARFIWLKSALKRYHL
jgi:hypothetical protein